MNTELTNEEINNLAVLFVTIYDQEAGNLDRVKKRLLESSPESQTIINGIIESHDKIMSNAVVDVANEYDALAFEKD